MCLGGREWGAGCSPTAPGRCLHFECRGAPARVSGRGDARAALALAPPPRVCVETLTLPDLTLGRRGSCTAALRRSVGELALRLHPRAPFGGGGWAGRRTRAAAAARGRAPCRRRPRRLDALDAGCGFSTQKALERTRSQLSSGRTQPHSLNSQPSDSRDSLKTLQNTAFPPRCWRIPHVGRALDRDLFGTMDFDERKATVGVGERRERRLVFTM